MSGGIRDVRCWEPYTGAPAKNCTLPPGHDPAEEHHHEYSGLSWTQRSDPTEPRTRPSPRR
ncbi:hypothetical protein RB196_15980 [Streptomyces sp. PmtA]|uniref:hypothetical protein n=1 Tax=Streptomyces sp. PmtA TaxID=3074275 RepID=UPI003014C202